MPINLTHLTRLFPINARSLDDLVRHVEKSEAKWAEARPRFIHHRTNHSFSFSRSLRRYDLYESTVTYTSETKHGRPIVLQLTYGMQSEIGLGLGGSGKNETFFKLFVTADATLEWMRERLMERLPFIIDTYVAYGKRLSEEKLQNLRHAANRQGITPYRK